MGILTIIGLIKAIGHIIDAVTDPLIASCSDKSRHPDGRRIPLMKKAAIPFGLCALLMFFVPLGKVSGLNAVWIAAFMWGYYFFFTLYIIPHNALIPEPIRDGPLRVNAYTVSSFFFVTGSALGYVSPLIVSLFKSAGLATLWAWRTTFGIYTLIGIILLMIPACTIREKDYVHSVLPNVSLGASLRHAFSNPHFRLVTLGQLLENTGMAFFQACIMYYVTSLMGLPGAMMADIIQYDTVTTGINQEGIFGAARSFIVKMGNSLAIMIVPSLVVTGAAAGENVGVPGLKLTAVAGSLFCLLAVFVFLRYREKDVLAAIAAGEKK